MEEREKFEPVKYRADFHTVHSIDPACCEANRSILGHKQKHHGIIYSTFSYRAGVKGEDQR